eukprot:7826388-Prorocentrum_lima.AAC.1
MTSSLVGSEMCIRDSLMRYPRVPSHYVRRVGTEWGGYGSPPQPSPGSVSYTHLTLPTICSV